MYDLTTSCACAACCCNANQVLLAKFEVCSGASCFNRGYEDAKAKGAKKCVKGLC